MAVGNTFGRFFNDSDLDQVENFVNGILSTPDIPRENDNERISSDFLNNFFEENEDNNKNKSELDQVLSQFSVPAERLLRYNAYDEIYRSVAMIRRIVKVYKSNIIQKNPVNGLWYLLRKTDFSKEKNIDTEQWADLSKKYYEGVLTVFKIQHYLKNLYLHDQLMYGNCVLEVVDLKKETDKVDLKKISILNEIGSLENQVSKFNRSTPDLMIEEAIKTIASSLYKVIPITEEIVGKVDEEVKAEENSRELRFKNVLIRAHKPHNIIILETKYRTTLGYLEVCRDANSSANNITKTLSSITSRISSIVSDGERDTVTSRDEILNRIIKYMLKKVTNSEAKFNDEVIQNLKRFVVEQNYQNNQSNLKPVEVRFIPVNRIVNFSFPSSENYPYGGSVIEPLLLPGKLFILSQLSNIYMKLSRAPLTRKWIID